MQTLRRAHRLARLLLAWFTLALGVAVAAPVLHPQRMELVCSGSGSATLIVSDEDGGTAQVHRHSQDCSLCVLAAAPPRSIEFTVHQLPPPAAPVFFEPAPVAVSSPSPFEARAPPAA